ncbi:MAG: HrpA-like helicase [Satyrvirus sp.]|uniref:RNA helicase n=1 Tax=Satyrvirus sp. TaxID=2487771 RepID=A0A3G5AFT3_9VIRU|nr:MAG: HrpA-like helicase [Satyrvirus sp.]
MDKIGILDPEGKNPNPLTGEPYSQEYKDLAKTWSKFSAYEKANEILDDIKKYQLLFVISSTGSGKTVMVPKFILHYTNYKGKVAIILPKRIVTLSAAAFSAKTLDVELGKQVGYVYKGSPKEMLNNENRLVYMTTGTIIMKFMKDPLLKEYDAIVVDEAHERRTEIDLILLFLKNLLESGKRPDLRVIIMSATIDGSKYREYFSKVESKIINISGQPNFEIKTYYLDKPTTSYMDTGLEVIDNLVTKETKKDILFFITSSNEAYQLCKQIRQKYPKVYCIEVYADMDKTLRLYAESSDEFLELGNYDQKLVMATNVAESSITIDGLKYVIDSCYEVYNYFNPEYFGNILEKRLITKAQALQRRGRVGRTEPGVCYHLVTKEEFDSLKEYPDPDILKQDITMDMLKVIQLTESKTYAEGNSLLNKLMDPPKKSYIDAAYNLYSFYKIIDSDGKLTKIGKDVVELSSLPINLALFLIYSYQLYCAKEASIIIAMVEETKGKINNLFFKADTICDSECSKAASKDLIKNVISKKGDHLTLLNIYQKFKETTDQKAWVRKYGIKIDILNKAKKTADKYYYKIINISRAPQISRVENTNIKKKIVEALKLSHKHLAAIKMVPVYPKKKIDGQINRESVLYYSYSRKELSNKNFVYNELTNINNNWEFSIVTLV